MRKAWSVTHEEHADILNRWLEGQSSSTISKAVGISQNRISKIVCKARARGDFRAVHHFEKDGSVKGRYRYRPKTTEVRAPMSAVLG